MIERQTDMQINIHTYTQFKREITHTKTREREREIKKCNYDYVKE